MAMLGSYCLFVSGIKLIIFICTLFHRLSLGNQYIFTSQYLQNIASKKDDGSSPKFKVLSSVAIYGFVYRRIWLFWCWRYSADRMTMNGVQHDYVMCISIIEILSLLSIIVNSGISGIWKNSILYLGLISSYRIAIPSWLLLKTDPA